MRKQTYIHRSTEQTPFDKVLNDNLSMLHFQTPPHTHRDRGRKRERERGRELYKKQKSFEENGGALFKTRKKRENMHMAV